MAIRFPNMQPGGGYSSEYTGEPGDIPFQDVNSAIKFYQAQQEAQKAKALKQTNLRAATSRITSAAQERPNFTGVQPSAPPSGMSGGSAWNESGMGYSTGLVPPGTEGGTPHLDIPAYDQERVEALAQRVAAPSLRKLRSEVQSVQGGVYDNPNVKALTLRQALQGYGAGLESTMSGALGAGATMYGNEYDPQVQAAHANFEAQLQAQRLASQERQAALSRAFQAWSQTGDMPGQTNARGLPIRIPAA